MVAGLQAGEYDMIASAVTVAGNLALEHTTFDLKLVNGFTRRFSNTFRVLVRPDPGAPTAAFANRGQYGYVADAGNKFQAMYTAGEWTATTST